jgi:hypothetical protein
MRQTNNKASRSAKKREPKEVEPKIKKIDKSTPSALPLNPEKRYININEYDSELATSNKRLWFVVIFLSVMLFLGWLLIIKSNIQKQASGLGFDNLKQEINTALAKFDTQIATSKANSPLTAVDVTAIKNDLEEQIKNNPDASLWPNHEFTQSGLSLNFPSNWKVMSEAKDSLAITDKTTSTSDYTNLSILVQNNANSLSLEKWLARNEDLDGYKKETQTFIFTSNTPEIISYSKSNVENNQSEQMYFISSNKKIIKVNVNSFGVVDYYLSLTKKIIQTIKIN